MTLAFAFATFSWPTSFSDLWVVSREFITWPAIQMLKMGIVLYSELFLAMTCHLKIVGGDQMPTAWRNAGEGTVSSMSLRMITRVTSVIPMFF